jgi:hypothetical protein
MCLLWQHHIPYLPYCHSVSLISFLNVAKLLHFCNQRSWKIRRHNPETSVIVQCSLLWCDTTQSGKGSRTFWRNILPPSSGLLYACFWLLAWLRERAHHGNWQPQRNRNFRKLLSDWVEHVELNGAAQIEETATQLAEVWETQLPGNWASQSSHSALPRSFLVSAVLTCFCDSFVSFDGMKGW